jgi:proline iminopeptidase
MEHPNKTSELVLRGIFLLRQKEVDWLYQGPMGAGYVYPEDWAPYRDCIPEAERGDMMAAYGRRLRGEMGTEEMHRAAKAWSVWEGRVSKLRQEPIESTATVYGNDKFSLAFARIENHYFMNKGFFPRDGYLLEKKNLDKIRHIPTYIVQGRYDVVCPAVSAYDLHQALPHAHMTYTITGHSAFETEIIENLIKATDILKTNKA